MQSSKQVSVIGWCLIGLTFAYPLRAGTVTFASSDNAPLYGGGTELVTTSTSSVTITATDTNGASLTISYSGGLKVISDTGSGTASESLTLGFSKSNSGQINKIQINLTHQNTSGPTPCTPNKLFTFTACIPQVTVPLNAITNSFSEYEFETSQTVSGLDDFSQVQFQQWKTIKTALTDGSGNVSYPADDNSARALDTTKTGTMDWSALSGGSGATFVIGSTAIMSPPDDHSLNNDTNQVTINNVTYTYAFLQQKTALFEVYLRRSSPDHGNLFGATFGYTWDNYNAKATHGSVTAAFSGPSYSGEYTNTSGLYYLPSTHTP